MHTHAIPRLGGVSFFPTLLFTLCLVTGIFCFIHTNFSALITNQFISEILFLVCGLTLLYIVGIADDLVGVRYRQKLVVQFICAAFFPLSGLYINNLYGIFGIHEIPMFLGMPITMLLVIYLTNAINLIDGIDGLASGLSIVSLIILGTLFLLSDLWVYAMIAYTTLGILLPFFYYNVFGQAERGKKIFMGDTGSLTLGYILSFLAVKFSMHNQAVLPYTQGAIIVAFSTLLVPMLDVVRVILYRLRTGKNIFQPDMNHIHHKFLGMGFTPRRAMISILSLACIFSCANIILAAMINMLILIIGDVLIWISLNLWFNKLRAAREKQYASRTV